MLRKKRKGKEEENMKRKGGRCDEREERKSNDKLERTNFRAR